MMNNNRGFMMAEVIVVSAIIFVFLTGLYLSYNKLFFGYNTRINYYDTTTLYRLAYYRDVLIEEEKMNDTLLLAKNGVINVFDNGANSILRVDNLDSVFIIYNFKRNNIDSTTLNNYTVNSTFKDYMDYLKTSADLTRANYVMVMESCFDEDDCKYAYLEVYDGSET